MAAKLGTKDVKVVDASWCMPNEKKDIYADHAKIRLPGAVLFGMIINIYNFLLLLIFKI